MPEQPTEIPAPRIGRETMYKLRKLAMASEDTANDEDVSDNDVRLARIKAGNTRLAIIGAVLVIVVGLAVFGGVPLTMSFFGAEANVNGAGEAPAVIPSSHQEAP